uniref:Cytochrome c oxidase subunit 3 n=1 Tax=Euciroa cf. queenslandica STW-2017 TaxID=1969321 RepID=A0A1U9XPE9_9BIVA|nr:cytochrome c oxidase subunit III [Euciroa cf. queenslandica STW-2017]AQZ26124.1 cytochrome c oxidase subunit III [Euciroa cf. queenslandica STW-2017]
MSYLGHGFHLVKPSPWPLLSGMTATMLALSLIGWFHGVDFKLFCISFILIAMVAGFWWRDVIREGMVGNYTPRVVWNLKTGMMLFLVSEAMFFVSFFWAFLHSSLAPTGEVGGCWPPGGIRPFNPWGLPAFNTALLVSSGVTVNWAQTSLKHGDQKQTLMALGVTIFYGLLFMRVQTYEYWHAAFTVADGVYGSTFFVTTGFHASHVMVGLIFLLVTFMRMCSKQFTHPIQLGFRFCVWYWHFVDVIWIGVWFLIYWWGTWSYMF